MVAVFLMLVGSQEVTFSSVSVVFLLSLLGGVVAVLPAAVGTFHASAMFGLVMVGYAPNEALVLAIGLHIQAFVFALVFTGGVSLWKSNDLAELIERGRSLADKRDG
jgi:hypothetical protein